VNTPQGLALVFTQGVLLKVRFNEVGLSCRQRQLVEPAALCALDVGQQRNVVVSGPEIGRGAIAQVDAVGVTGRGCRGSHFGSPIPRRRFERLLRAGRRARLNVLGFGNAVPIVIKAAAGFVSQRHQCSGGRAGWQWVFNRVSRFRSICNRVIFQFLGCRCSFYFLYRTLRYLWHSELPKHSHLSLHELSHLAG